VEAGYMKKVLSSLMFVDRMLTDQFNEYKLRGKLTAETRIGR